MTIDSNILQDENTIKDELISLLQSGGNHKKALFKAASLKMEKHTGKKVYFRGLIEVSNVCEKNCYYCGIRKENKNIKRYTLSDDEVLAAARFAYNSSYGSLVIQSGEVSGESFTKRIEQLIYKVKELSDGTLGITLSLGEQPYKTYQRWFKAGAHRYLLRVETSNKELYKKLHPVDNLHSFDERLACIKNLQSIGYQTGTGVMIGLPFQDYGHLAEDLIFFRNLDVDMVGMGPYIEHSGTPLYKYRHKLWPIKKRFDTSLKMIASLRLLMKDINIAAATALQAIDPLGREKAIKAGANIIMPNITPGTFRNDYALYDNKPCVDENPEQCKGCLDARIALTEKEIGYGELGDSKHFFKRIGKSA